MVCQHEATVSILELVTRQGISTGGYILLVRRDRGERQQQASR